jgi:hypothetical protein
MQDTAFGNNNDAHQQHNSEIQHSLWGSSLVYLTAIYYYTYTCALLVIGWLLLSQLMGSTSTVFLFLLQTCSTARFNYCDVCYLIYLKLDHNILRTHYSHLNAVCHKKKLQVSLVFNTFTGSHCQIQSALVRIS